MDMETGHGSTRPQVSHHVSYSYSFLHLPSFVKYSFQNVRTSNYFPLLRENMVGQCWHLGRDVRCLVIIICQGHGYQTSKEPEVEILFFQIQQNGLWWAIRGWYSMTPWSTCLPQSSLTGRISWRWVLKKLAWERNHNVFFEQSLRGNWNTYATLKLASMQQLPIPLRSGDLFNFWVLVVSFSHFCLL